MMCGTRPNGYVGYAPRLQLPTPCEAKAARDCGGQDQLKQGLIVVGVRCSVHYSRIDHQMQMEHYMGLRR